MSLALCLSTLAVSAPVQAKMTLEDIGDGFTIVGLSGSIVNGDFDRFKQITQGLSAKTIVNFNSGGGALVEALDIGEMIRARGYATMVANGNMCASSCGLIWLAGVKRFTTADARIGFHAVFSRDGDEERESGFGNALVGAYMAKLNLSYAAVLFATTAPPEDMAWLSAADAKRLGIDYIALPKAVQPARQAAPADAGSAVEQRMKKLVMRYYAVWSTGGTDVSGLIMFYSDSVNFYGSTRTVAQVIDEKRRFSLRWPNRSYTVQPDTVFVRCDDVCAVSGVVSWDVSSPERGVRSTGSANFVLKVMPVNSPNGGFIVSENGASLGGHTEPLAASPTATIASPTGSPPAGLLPAGSFSTASSPAGSPSAEAMPVPSAEQQIASTTPRYGEGRQARIDYENWFNALADGPFKEGASFWAAHRSDKPSPSCTAVTGTAWQAGCNVAKSQLTPLDLRRRTEKDFWWGWNSL